MFEENLVESKKESKVFEYLMILHIVMSGIVISYVVFKAGEFIYKIIVIVNFFYDKLS